MQVKILLEGMPQPLVSLASVAIAVLEFLDQFSCLVPVKILLENKPILFVKLFAAAFVSVTIAAHKF